MINSHDIYEWGCHVKSMINGPTEMAEMTETLSLISYLYSLILNIHAPCRWCREAAALEVVEG